MKNTGDGFLLTFTGARAAIQFAVDVQEALATWRTSHPDTPLEVRIGVHTGEVETDGRDIVGRNVTIASRLCDTAAPGEVLASAVVADLADSASDLEFGDAREHQSSSGLIASTGTGATGWAKSINSQRAEPLSLPSPTSPQLAWFVREAWESPTTQATRRTRKARR